MYIWYDDVMGGVVLSGESLAQGTGDAGRGWLLNLGAHSVRHLDLHICTVKAFFPQFYREIIVCSLRFGSES